MTIMSVRFRMVISFMVIFFISTTMGAFCGESVFLVTLEEAAQPSDRAVVEKLNDGPMISMVSPENGPRCTVPFDSL